MTKYRSKYLEVEAFQFTSNSINGSGFFRGFLVRIDLTGYHVVIPTDEGDVRINIDDWIIVGPGGRKSRCRHDLFSERFQEVKGEVIG